MVLPMWFTKNPLESLGRRIQVFKLWLQYAKVTLVLITWANVYHECNIEISGDIMKMIMLKRFAKKKEEK
jgi:hypothetical protein